MQHLLQKTVNQRLSFLATTQNACPHTLHKFNNVNRKTFGLRLSSEQRKEVNETSPRNNERENEKKQSKHQRTLTNALVGTAVVAGLFGSYTHFFSDDYEEKKRKITRSVTGAFRFARCIRYAAMIAADYKLTLRNIKTHPDMTTHREDELMSQVHLRSAKRLLALFERNAGIFIKAGQHMSALVYVLPPEYTQTMIPLFDKAPYRPYAEIEQVFKEEFGKSPDEIFEDFHKIPASSASLAQVHKAKYRGNDVAVKVQYPGLREQCWSDVHTIEFIINIAARIFPEFKMKWLVDEFNRNLPKELDFVHEAQNTTRVAANFKGSPLKVHMPTPLFEMTTSKILTMEWIDGFPLNNLEKMRELNISPERVAHRLNQVFCEQIFKHGFVHCDPHPGNVFVRKAGKDFELVLLDNGLYREYDSNFRLDYAKLWWSLYSGDEQGIKESARKIAGTSSYKLFSSMLTTRSWNKVSGSLSNHLTAYDPNEMNELRTMADTNLIEISKILSQVPPELLLLLKTNDLLRSVNAKLVSPEASFEVLATTMKYCLNAINRHKIETEGGIRNRISSWWSSFSLNIHLKLFRWFLHFSSLRQRYVIA